MPPDLPAGVYTGTPGRCLLPAGTRLHRLHRRERPATEFSPVVADLHFGGGRFDGIAGDEYPYLYATFAQDTAIAEVLLRSIPFDEKGTRQIPGAAVIGRRLSAVCLNSELILLSLTTTDDLAAVCQDEWLIHAEPREYGQTRRWAQWLRAQASWAQGLMWPSKRDPGEKSVVLFGDRCAPGDLSSSDDLSLDLDDGPGNAWLNEVLAKYRARIRRPLKTDEFSSSDRRRFDRQGSDRQGSDSRS